MAFSIQSILSFSMSYYWACMPPHHFWGPMETMSVFVHLVIQMPLNELDGKGKCYAVLCNCSSVQKVMKILSFLVLNHVITILNCS